MVFTRSRKRDAGDLDGTNRLRNNSNKANVILDNEPSVLPPKAKRQRTTVATSTTTGATSTSTAAARTRNGRALKPVATNAISNARSAKPTRGTVSKAKAKVTTVSNAAKPSASRTSRRSRTETEKQESHVVGEKQPQRSQEQQLEQQRDDEEKTSSTGATHAGDDNVNTKASSTLTTNTVTKSASTESFEPIEAGASSQMVTAMSYQNGIPDDIDARDADDPLSVTDYVEDMYNHFRSKEEISSVDYMYMGMADDGKQPHINESMRCILVDWLIEVHYKFKLFPETLYLTVNILDRFLAQTREIITKRDLQLVGVTSLLVSAKYEEMYVPELRDLTYICDGAYTEARILRMEEKILKTLNYNVTVPTPHTFLIRFLKAAHADKLMAQLACFLLDGTLLSLESLTCRWRPSQLAAAAILLARRQLGRHNWSPTLVAYSLYREEDVMPVARALLQNKHRLEKNRELMALAKKYSKTKYGKVSHIVFLPLESSDEASRTSEDGDESLAHSEL